MKDLKDSHKRNTDGLMAFKQAERLKNVEKIEKAIQELKKKVRTGKLKKVTVADVAREASVAPATIYNNKALIEKVRQAAGLKLVVEKKLKPNISAEEEYLRERIKKLTDEVQELKRRNELLLGNLERKTTEVIELKTRIAILGDSEALPIGEVKGRK